jgi:hypothetical protein
MKKLIVITIVLALTLVFVTATMAATNNTDPAATPAPTVSPAATAAVNLALNKPVSENNHTQYFFSKNINDANINSYWEGAVNSYPDLLTVDLGAASNITSIVIKLNPKLIWEERTQTIEVLGSTDGTTFTTLVAAAIYTFDPETNKNIVTIPVTANTRYLRLTFTTNSGATGGQVAELEVY